MTYTHIACTNEDGKRVIQPFAPLQLSFVERSNGAARAVYYIAGKATQADVREKFSDILEMMVATGVAIDCTQERKWDVGLVQVEQTSNPNYGGGAIALGRFHPQDLSVNPHTGNSYAEVGPGIIENLKKQLAAKDEELLNFRETVLRSGDAATEAGNQLTKLGVKMSAFSTNILKDAIIELANQVWSRQTEIHRLNAKIGQMERKYGIIKEDTQPEPPAHALSDEAQGIKGDGVTGD